MKEKSEGMLSPYRVLDLADEKGLMCGKVLADLGADVIKIERPGGDSARSIGPFYHDEPDPEKSLFWFAFNTNKRGITLDIETADGQEIFKRLVKSADFVVESFAPGYIDKLGLGYSELEKLNPGVIVVSITPFGQSGTYRDYNTSDIVAWALGGYMFPHGDLDRAPVQISHHSQVYLQAGLEAAAGAMLAHQYREMTGEGQQVDVSVYECIARFAHYVVGLFDMQKVMLPHGVGWRPRRHSWMWPCKDGHVIWIYWGGQHGKRRNTPLIRWMDSEGKADDFLKEIDWETVSFDSPDEELADRIVEPTKKFFMTRTRAEIIEQALKHRAMVYPVSTADDILNNVHSKHLAARGYWAEVEHPELGTSMTYPGAFVNSSEARPKSWRRAPLIGEHNREIYEKELGISREQLTVLKQANII
jgi:benzylsuccinate CoA-transferase BbsE subunit